MQGPSQVVLPGGELNMNMKHAAKTDCQTRWKTTKVRTDPIKIGEYKDQML